MSGILVALDGSKESEEVIPLVMSLATRLSTEITLLHVVDGLELPKAKESVDRAFLEQWIQDEKQAAAKYLLMHEERLIKMQVTAKVVVEAGRPAQHITRYAETHNVDMVAMTTHGRSGLARWALGSVSAAVLQTVRRPLLLYRPGMSRGEPFEVRRLLVALDGSPAAEGALGPATELAKGLSVPVDLIMAIPSPLMSFVFLPDAGAALVAAGQLAPVSRREAEDYLNGIAGTLRADGIAGTPHVVGGEAGQAIVEAARKPHDCLTVITTHGRSGWDRLVLGSVADHVVRHAGGPVLLLRSNV